MVSIRFRQFSVKSAHSLEARWAVEGTWPRWKLIWSLKVQEWVKTFVWQMAHDADLNQCSKVEKEVVAKRGLHKMF